jgi:hypothetical protein
LLTGAGLDPLAAERHCSPVAGPFDEKGHVGLGGAAPGQDANDQAVGPDLCRQEGGCPEVWHIDSFRGKRELPISNLAEIEEFVVIEHRRQVTRPAFAEMMGS